MGASSDRTTKIREAPLSPETQQVSVPVLTILSHMDLNRVGHRTVLFQDGNKQAAVSRNEPSFYSPTRSTGPLNDEYISRTPFFLTKDHRGNIWLNPNNRKHVVADGERVVEETLFSFAQVRRGVILELADRVCLLLHETIEAQISFDEFGMVSRNEGMAKVHEDIRRVADLNVPVLIRGESGSGKELVAQAIHAASSRSSRELVAVNLGAMAPNLAASELLGSVRGGFTGAVSDRTGYFRTAHRSTLFLDEIGEAPPEVQALLMRVLETSLVYPVGSQKGFEVDIRLLTATDANLEDMVEKGLFKAPLLHRLGAYEIWIPPLRARRDDIMLLFMHFALQILKTMNDAPPTGEVPWIPTTLAARLLSYHWPGNVRQLRNVVNQVVIDNRDRPFLEIGPRVERLFTSANEHPQRRVTDDGSGQAAASSPPLRRKPSEISGEELAAAMEDSGWEPAQAARVLGVSRPSIYDLIKKHGGLRMVEDLSEEEIEVCLKAHGGDMEGAAASLKVSLPGLRRRARRMGLS